MWSPDALAFVVSTASAPPDDGWKDAGGCALASGEWDSKPPAEVDDPWWGCYGVEVTGLGPCAGTGCCTRQAPAALLVATLLAIAIMQLVPAFGFRRIITII